MRWGVGTVRLFLAVFLLWTIGLVGYGLHYVDEQSRLRVEISTRQCMTVAGTPVPVADALTCMRDWEKLWPHFNAAEWVLNGGYWIWLLGPVLLTAMLLGLLAIAIFVWRGFAPKSRLA